GGPKTPQFLTRSLVVGHNKTTRSGVAARNAGNQHSPHNHRRSCAVIVVVPVRQRCLPQKRAGRSIESKEMCIVGSHEHTIARNGCAAICTLTCIPMKSGRTGALEMP